MCCSGNLAQRARALTPNFIILCVTTWSLLNTTILDRSATTVSLLFGSSASQDVLQILYYQFGAIASHLSSILSSFFAGLGGDACGGQHLRRDAARRGGAAVETASSELSGAATIALRLPAFQPSQRSMKGLAI